jgi:hypothetical protein
MTIIPHSTSTDPAELRSAGASPPRPVWIVVALSGAQILFTLVGIPFALDDGSALRSLGELYAALLEGSGLVSTVSGSDMIDAAELITVALDLGACAVVGWLAARLVARRRWARPVVACLGALSVLGPVLAMDARSWMTAVLAGLVAVSGIAQVLLLYRTDVGHWFRQ